ncbi:ATP-binding protein [Thalassobius sp. Cn5-15]|uniref:ATP-binding protein n=1 Tax=Thalassobius sp. Cn5-15 TaxID=2917763 RepID=UPI001EF378B0|nr:ATP-binding protein [Thalassobius sp. Cn5-15]MCG7494865.1 ATP-binding protein [Thalassobius sp. Cn5-15]
MSFKLRGSNLPVLVLALLALIVGCFLVSDMVRRNFENELRSELENTLRNNQRAIAHWMDTRKSEVLAHAEDPALLRATRALLPLKDDRQALLQASAQRHLRTFFGSFLYQNHVNGYFLIARDGTSLASSRDSNIGTPNLLLAQPLLFERLLSGEALLTQLTRSDIHNTNSKDIRDNATNFVAAPLRDETGRIIAVLALRLFPQRELFRMMHFADTPGFKQAYAFNQQGALLSDVSELEDLRASGIWQYGRDHLLLRPEGSSRYSPQVQRNILPVQKALRGENSSNIEGYINYAGQRVVGAWHYYKDLGFGVAIEQPFDAAYAPLHFLRMATIAAFSIGSAMVVLIFMWMVEAGRRVDAHRRRMAATLNATQDVNFLVDVHGRVQMVNPALKSVFGTAPELGRGQRINRFIDLGRDSSIRLTNAGLRELARNAPPATVRCNGIHNDGHRFPIAIHIEPLPQGRDVPLEFLIVVHDYSEIERREDELRRALRLAEAGNRSKSSFLSTISHELRSPLLSVIAAIELLTERNQDREDEDLLHSSQRSTRQLLGIIDDILDFSRIEAETLELTRQDISLESVLSDALSTVRTQASDSGVRLLPYCDPALPLVQADPMRLRQIMANLLSNAIKFSAGMDHTGLVEVSLTTQSISVDQMTMQITVRDNGIGMTADTMEKIFRPFTQDDGSIRRKVGGTGLGLTISDRLIKMMGGQISVLSDKGVGTTFEVQLPFQMGASELPRLRSLDQRVVGLIVSDHAVVGGLQRYIHSAGGRVIQNWRATQTESTRQPDLIITLAGDETTQELPEGIPVLHITRDDATSVGPRNMATKTDLPLVQFLPSHVIACVTDLLADSTIDPAIEPAPQPRSTAIQIAAANTRAGRQVLLVEDDDMTREITLRMLTQLGITARAVNNGEEGLKAWRSGSYDLLLSDCHMPIMDGFQMAAGIRAEERQLNKAQTPIIAVSADMTMEIERLCHDSEINEYIPKPLTPQKLRLLLDGHMPAQKRQSDV